MHTRQRVGLSSRFSQTRTARCVQSPGNSLPNSSNVTHTKFYPLDEAQAGRAIWSTISTAVICRAALQLHRATLADSPLGMPLQGLDLRTARSTSSTLPTAQKRPNMGINTQPPGKDAEEEDEEPFQT